MQWIDNESVLSFNGNDISYGDVIPKGLDKSRLKELIEAGKVGDIPEAIDPEVFSGKVISDLEKEVKKLQKKNDGYKDTVSKSGNVLKGANEEIDDLKEQNIGLNRVIDDLKNKVSDLEKEVKKLTKKDK